MGQGDVVGDNRLGQRANCRPVFVVQLGHGPTGCEPGDQIVRRTIRAGGWGFMSKSDEPEVLLETISTVSHGRVSFPYVDMEADENDPLGALTVRERELLAALADGWSNLQIAARIGISRNTVKYHLKNLYDKLNVNNRAMAVALFMTQTGTREQR